MSNPTFNEEAFVRHLQQILKLEDQPKDQLSVFFHLFSSFFISLTKDSKLYFATLFARISYAGSFFGISGRTRYHLHHFRMQAETLLQDDNTANQSEEMQVAVKEGIWALLSFMKEWHDIDLYHLLALDHHFVSGRFLKREEKKKVTFRKTAKVVAIGVGKEPFMLQIVDEIDAETDYLLHYAAAGKNDVFTSDIQHLLRNPGLPATLSLQDVEIDSQGIYRPNYIVIEPDYLIDISSIAECFQDFATPATLHLLRKFLPVEPNPAILLGHISNFFLDALIHNPDLIFKEIFPAAFHLNPLAFSLLSNDDIRKIMEKAERHFENLKRTIREDFDQAGIVRKDCFIEPAFYSPHYGIQGRLDLFFQSPDSMNRAIVELKSGKPYRPNNYGLNANHYAQTLLYDLLIQSSTKFKAETTSYILYSNQATQTLRFAPPVRSLQKESIHLRNQLLLLEFDLQGANGDGAMAVLAHLKAESFPDAKGFLQRDIQNFENVFKNLSDLERTYVSSFTSFIAREHTLAKIGEQGVDNVNGLASMWLDTTPEKEQKFSLFKSLRLDHIESEDGQTIVHLKCETKPAPLTNFRPGDIAVLYPFSHEKDAVLYNQIYKCSLTEMSEEGVSVRLRNQQVNLQSLEIGSKWNIEHDVLDSGFVSSYRSLFYYMSAENQKRSVFLGTRPPALPKLVELSEREGLTDQQNALLKKVISAKDYFLLWGPPGTGKTSVMLREMVRYYLTQSKSDILLLAYTNRAVDEICAAVETLGEPIKKIYTRIGSGLSTHTNYRNQLFQKKTEKYIRRSEITSFIKSQRVFISTISSIAGKQELMNLKRFDVCIIDEASQILEPMLAGLLPKFDKSIMIGDHKQLPAVVIQGKKYSKVDNKLFEQINLTDMRNSYFERMMTLCHQNGWDWAFDQLTLQGRMHPQIMDFANTYFYEELLDVIPGTYDQEEVVYGDYKILTDPNHDILSQVLNLNRMVYLPSKIAEEDLIVKTNAHEAELCSELVRRINYLFEANGGPWRADTLGIITPFRAQIAQIREALSQAGLDHIPVTIDTVERYQGAARDIIILSVSVNSEAQLQSIISESDEGLDRKLNVSVTRARKQFILLGNRELLKKNRLYTALMQACHTFGDVIPD